MQLLNRTSSPVPTPFFFFPTLEDNTFKYSIDIPGGRGERSRRHTRSKGFLAGNRIMGNVFLLLQLLFFSSWLSSVTASVSYDHRAVIINGQRRVLISGSIHYPRSTPEVPLIPMWFILISTFLNASFFFFISGFDFCGGCRCGLILFRRPKMGEWM